MCLGQDEIVKMGAKPLQSSKGKPALEAQYFSLLSSAVSPPPEPSAMPTPTNTTAPDNPPQLQRKKGASGLTVKQLRAEIEKMGAKPLLARKGKLALETQYFGLLPPLPRYHLPSSRSPS